MIHDNMPYITVHGVTAVGMIMHLLNMMDVLRHRLATTTSVTLYHPHDTTMSWLLGRPPRDAAGEHLWRPNVDRDTLRVGVSNGGGPYDEGVMTMTMRMATLTMTTLACWVGEDSYA